MRPPGFQLDPHQGSQRRARRAVAQHAGVGLHGRIVRDRLADGAARPPRLILAAIFVVGDAPAQHDPAARRALDGRHLGAVQGTAGERHVDGASGSRQRTPHQRKVLPLESAISPVSGELLGKTRMRGVRLGDHQQAGRVLIQTVDDAGPAHAADARQRGPAVGDEGIHERAGLMPSSRMHDEAGRLIDDDERVVLIDDGERDGFGDRLGGGRRRQIEHDRVARFDPVSGVA